MARTKTNEIRKEEELTEDKTKKITGGLRSEMRELGFDVDSAILQATKKNWATTDQGLREG